MGRMQEVWSDIMQEAANVPLADRVALRPQKKDTFDLTLARIFLEKPEYQKRVRDPSVLHMMVVGDRGASHSWKGLWGGDS